MHGGERPAYSIVPPAISLNGSRAPDADPRLAKKYLEQALIGAGMHPRNAAFHNLKLLQHRRAKSAIAGYCGSVERGTWHCRTARGVRS